MYPFVCVREQVGGWSEVYEGLTFATVRGAGHEVPLFQPSRAFRMFQSFLAGKTLPKS
jgi:serine carboxypeptidase-like clade II